MTSIAEPARSPVTPWPRQPRITWRGLNHVVHSYQTRRAVASLSNSASGDAVTVVVTGDSTTLDTSNDSLTPFDTFYGLITRQLQRENPTTTFRFINRGVGGATWMHLNTAAVTYPAWYTAQATGWINSYISPLGNSGLNKAPDLIIVMMGTNDNSNAGLVSPAGVLAQFAHPTNFPITPDVWLCTSFGRTRNTTYSSVKQNYGAVMASNVNRAIALGGHGKIAQTGNIYPRQIGLLDFGRMWQQCVLGTDPAAQPLTQLTAAQLVPYQTMTALGTTGWDLPECDGDFDFVATFPEQGTTLLAGRAMRLAIGATMGGGIRSEFLLQTNGTTVSTTYRPGLGSVSFNGSSVMVDAGSDVVIRCTAKQSHCYLSINGTVVFDTLMVRATGVMRPRFYFAIDGVNNLTMSLTNYRVGRGLPIAATLNDLTAWGENPVGILGATGGNMVNHPSSLYVQEIVASVLANESLCLA